MRTVSVQQALQYVADHPELETDELIQVRIHELVARTLFDIANKPDGSPRGNAKANKARQMLLHRLVGRRRAGSHPATRRGVPVELVDLTVIGEVES